VRFENLPIFPVGTVLIQDFAGNVFNSGIDVTTLVNLIQNKNEETSRITVLEKELQELKALLKKANPTSISPTETKATLYQNYPNPTGGFTNIKVVVEENNATVQCNIYDINNTLVQSHAIKGNGEQILSVDTQSLSSIVYFYTLEINGKVIDSKKLIIQR
jgi:translation initiation factor 2B subunit (eIF-2B alpha/beta/delta family)